MCTLSTVCDFALLSRLTSGRVFWVAVVTVKTDLGLLRYYHLMAA